jgi:hypothetical protein
MRTMVYEAASFCRLRNCRMRNSDVGKEQIVKLDHGRTKTKSFLYDFRCQHIQEFCPSFSETSFYQHGSPPGVKFAPRGELVPQGWNLSPTWNVHPQGITSPPGDKIHPRGQLRPWWSKFSPRGPWTAHLMVSMLCLITLSAGLLRSLKKVSISWALSWNKSSPGVNVMIIEKYFLYKRRQSGDLT